MKKWDECFNELKHFSLSCKYLEHIISRSFFKTEFLSPAPNPDSRNNVILFVTIHYAMLKVEI